MGSWRQILAEEGCSDERERISSVFLRLEPSPKWSAVLWLFLAVLSRSIGDLVTQSLADFTTSHSKTDPRDLWPLRHLMRKHDLTNILTILTIFDIFFTIFNNFDNFGQFLIVWTILTILENVDNFLQFWQFLTILTIFDNFLTIFDNFDNFQQCWRFLTI